MIERRQRGVDLGWPDSPDIRNDNTVLEKGGEWFLKFDNGTSLKVPTRMGKVLYLGLKLMGDHLKDKGPRLSKNEEDRNPPERRFQSFDCHTFVSACMGFTKDELQEHPSMGTYIVHTTFEDTKYTPIWNGKQFISFVREEADGRHIGVVAIKDDAGALTHSFLIFLSAGDVYIAQKNGYTGSVLFSNAEDVVDGMLREYGNNISLLFKKK